MVTEFDSGDVTVTVAETTLFDTEVGAIDKFRGEVETLCFDLINDGAALTTLVAYIKGSKDGDYNILNAAWAAAGATLLYFSGNLALLASGAKGTGALRIYGAFAFKITATCATSTVVRVHGVGRG